jgi:transcriptional regulator with XRE-family HTH domain
MSYGIISSGGVIMRTKTTYKIPALRRLREDAKLSQKGLAKLAGIGESTVIRIEGGGGTNGITLVKIAEALRISRDDLTEAAHSAA